MFNFRNENSSFINCAKQFGKGALLFSVGILGYFGFKIIVDDDSKTQNRNSSDNLARNQRDDLISLNEIDSFLKPGSFGDLVDESLPIKSLIQINENRRTNGELIFGDEFQVNTYTIIDQNPAVASLGPNGFVVIWSGRCDGDSRGICGQRYDLIGTKIGDEFQINSYTTSSQSYPSVSNLAEGGFVVVWVSYGQDGHSYGIYGRIFNNTGIAQMPEFQVNTYTTKDQIHPAVASLGASGFVVVWASGFDLSDGQDGSGFGIYGRIFDDTGVAKTSEFQVNTYTTGAQGGSDIYDERELSISSFNNKDFIVVWGSESQDGDGSSGIYGQRYDLEGTKQGSEFQVNAYTIGDQLYPAVANLDNNDFVIVWTSLYQDGDGCGIYGQRYNATGYEIDNEFQINTYTTGYQCSPAVTNLETNGFVVVWVGVGQGDRGVYGQRFDSIGNKIDNEFQVSVHTANSQTDPSIANLGINDFIVVWESHNQEEEDDGVYGRIFYICSETSPILLANRLTVNEGGTVTLDDAMLSADYHSNSTKFYPLLYNVYNVQHGQFENNNNPGFPIIKFTKQQITNKEIGFVHDGSNFAPSYEIQAVDGGCAAENIPAEIVFISINDQPVIVNNQLIIDEGQTIFLNSTILSATDEETNNADLLFVVNDVQYGQFENTDNLGTAISSFTQQEITDNKIVFVHDNSNFAPSYKVKAYDGISESNSMPAEIIFNNFDDVPQIVTNSLKIKQGESLTITEEMLKATDEESQDSSLLFTIRTYLHGHFAYADATKKPIITFTQQEITDRKIKFVHDGTANAPKYELKVSDEALSSPWSAAEVTFYRKKEFSAEAIWVPIVGIGMCCICGAIGVFATIGGIYVFKARKQLKAQEQEIELLESSLELGTFLEDNKIRAEDLKIKNHLGAGAQATVYKAIWKGQAAAYKIFKTVDQNDIKGFEDEARIMLKSNHPNIVRLYGICIRQGTFGLVMEFMEMGTLKEVLKDKKTKLDWLDKWKIAFDLASVLEFLHEKDFVHRDIKTDNVLLHETGDGIHAKIADFGLSKMQTTKDQSATMAIGTFKYMAPEMALGSEDYEAGRFPVKPVDIYALGMTLVALITEKEPYPKRRNDMSIPAEVGQGKLWQKLNEQKCPFMFFNLTNRCRAIKSADRPTAEKIVEELDGMKSQVVDFKIA